MYRHIYCLGPVNLQHNIMCNKWSKYQPNDDNGGGANQLNALDQVYLIFESMIYLHL